MAQEKNYWPIDPFKSMQLCIMASVVSGGLFNAVAFAGTGYFFQN